MRYLSVLLIFVIHSNFADCASNDDKLFSAFSNLQRSAVENGEYEVQVLNRSYLADSLVFSPKYFKSTEMLSAHFPFRTNERFLEIGCGIGVTSIIAACDYNNQVVSVDINPVAVALTSKNAARFSVQDKLEVRLGCVFEAIVTSEKFDTIYWDLPYVYSEQKEISLLQRSVCDPGYCHIDEFLSQARQYLAKNGRIIVGFGSNGDYERFQALAALHHFAVHCLYQGFHPYREGISYQLFELVSL
jgi:release factor glutamine methyltransferase